MTATDWRVGHDRPCYRCRHWRGEGRSHGRCAQIAEAIAERRTRGVGHTPWTEAGCTCTRWTERAQEGWADEG